MTLPRAYEGAQPTAEYIQPNLNSGEVLNIVEKLIEYTLTTNNLSAGSVIGSLSVGNAASGISKLFDTVDSTENIKVQQDIYVKSEKEMWNKFSHNILPFWVQAKSIDPDYTSAFSPDFEVTLTFPEPKVFMTRKDRIDNAKLELDNGFTSMHRAIKDINPEMTDEEVDALIVEINKEKITNMEYFQRNMMNGKEVGSNNDQSNGDSEINNGAEQVQSDSTNTKGTNG